MARLGFGPFVIDLPARRLTRDGQPIVLTPKVFDTLVILVEARGEVVDRETFFKRLWPDTVVEERNLTVNMSTLRRALSPAGDVEVVETIPRAGYRLVLPVVDLTGAATLPDDGIASAGAVATVPAAATAPSSMRWWLYAAMLAVALLAPLTLAVLRPPGDATADSLRLSTKPVSDVAVTVLPFVVSGGIDAVSFGMGVADAVVSRLEAVPRVSATKMREVASYSAMDPVQIGRTLASDFVVDGVVQRSADGALLRLRILDVHSGEIRWSEEIEPQVSDHYQVQDVLAATVAGSVMRRIITERAWTRYQHRPASDEAYRAYLDARMYSNRIAAGGDIRLSISAYERAVAIEPSFAPAWSGLARARRAHSFTAGVNHDAEWALAYEATHRALDLDPNWPEGHQMLGMLKYSEWQWEEAEQHMRKAVALDPENDDSVTWLANLLRGQARWQECIEIYQQARTINPINWVQTQQLGEVLWHAGRHLEALGMLAEASRLNPGNATSHRLRAEVYDTMGDEREALAARKVAAQLNRDREYIETVLSEVPRGYRAVREAELQFSQRRHDLWGVAIGLTYLGRHEDALSALDQCITEKCGMSILIATEPRLKALHQFSRFRELAARVNLGHLVAN